MQGKPKALDSYWKILELKVAYGMKPKVSIVLLKVTKLEPELNLEWYLKVPRKVLGSGVLLEESEKVPGKVLGSGVLVKKTEQEPELNLEWNPKVL